MHAMPGARRKGALDAARAAAGRSFRLVAGWCGRAASTGATLAVAAALVSGCASLAPQPALEVTSGRIGVRVEALAERPAQSFSSAFELSGDSGRGELRLLTPLGTELARARWQPGGATLRDGQGETTFPSVEEMARAALGEPVPLAALPDWIAGRAWPGAGSVATSQGFRQLGWEVDLSERSDRRITARREAPPAVVVRVVLER